MLAGGTPKHIKVEGERHGSHGLRGADLALGLGSLGCDREGDGVIPPR